MYTYTDRGEFFLCQQYHIFSSLVERIAILQFCFQNPHVGMSRASACHLRMVSCQGKGTFSGSTWRLQHL